MVTGNMNALFALVSLVVVAACGPNAVVSPDSYEGRCQAVKARHLDAVRTRNYQAVELTVYEWPEGDGVTVPASGRTGVMTEANFVAGLRRGKARTTLLTGGAGVGKSTLNRSLQAQLCGEMPIAAVDLAWGLTATGSANPLLDAVAWSLGAAAGDDAPAAIRAAITDQPFVALLDAFDEVGSDKKKIVAGYVRDLTARFPAARVVVFSRPPVYAATRALFGEFDAGVGLPSAACNKIDWFVTVRNAPPWERDNFNKFVAHHGLKRRETTGVGCRYAYIKTYRDLEMIWTIAQPTGDKLLEADFATSYRGGQATLLDFYIKGHLLRGFEGGKFRPEQAMTVIDAMVLPLVPGFGRVPFSFTQGSCEAAVARAGQTANVQPDIFCKAMLASKVFAGKGASKHLASRTMDDYFVARAIASELAATPADKCAAVTRHKAHLESSEVASFLLGLPAGSNCMAHVLQQLCLGDMPAAWVAGAVRRGLPYGEQRIAAVGHAAEKISNEAPGGACVERVLEGLARQ